LPPYRRIARGLPEIKIIVKFMTQDQFARVSVEMPEYEDKKIIRKELTYEIENNDIMDEFTIKL
jgi:hypothetical protein